VDQLTHPDLHWFVPIVRPKTADPAKQVAEARELLGEVMAARRDDPLWGPPERMASHALASVRLLRKVVSLTPFMGKRKVVILGEADRLIVQEASQEAANALLKVLEEPPADTTIMLTTADPESLLPTIRSRSVPLRVGRVPDEAVREFLTNEVTPKPDRRTLDRRVVLADGCVGRALSDTGQESADHAAKALLSAVAKGPRAWATLALGQTPWSARGDFTGLLDALLLELRGRMMAATEADGEHVPSLLEAVRLVEEKRAEAQGNTNPQLALAVLASDLERVL
jgi:DNA polymerase-3 subunit delta'